MWDLFSLSFIIFLSQLFRNLICNYVLIYRCNFSLYNNLSCKFELSEFEVSEFELSELKLSCTRNNCYFFVLQWRFVVDGFVFKNMKNLMQIYITLTHNNFFLRDTFSFQNPCLAIKSSWLWNEIFWAIFKLKKISCTSLQSFLFN